MLTEYRIWLTVKVPAPLLTDQWEDLLAELAKSSETRGRVMSSPCRPTMREAKFTVSYPADDDAVAAGQAVDFVKNAINNLSWLSCEITVDQVEEVDLEKELQERYIPPK
jgi:hypothetical protein